MSCILNVFNKQAQIEREEDIKVESSTRTIPDVSQDRDVRPCTVNSTDDDGVDNDLGDVELETAIATVQIKDEERDDDTGATQKKDDDFYIKKFQLKQPEILLTRKLNSCADITR